MANSNRLPQKFMKMNRRNAIKTTALVTATCAVGPALLRAADPAPPSGPFKLPPLPYSFDALEPHIDARTMEIHHDKHHAAYVANLNKALAAQPNFSGKSIEDLLRDVNSLPENIRTAVKNQGGGHYNHSLFWMMMKKDGGGDPAASVKAAIDKSFGGFSQFKEKFTEAATKVFGSGWAWLVAGAGGLKIISSPNQDAPLSQGEHAILGLDVWEHAYYLKYQNRRPEYIAAWFNVVNWDFVAERLAHRAGKH
jgi:Fe-Mn family superoxide dismutase